MGEPARPPYYSIHNGGRVPGRDRARWIVSPEIRAAYTAVMDALDDGWEILRPLADVAQRYHSARIPGPPEAMAAAWVICMDVVDEYRGLVFAVWDSVPGQNGYARGALVNIPDECLDIVRYLHVSEMAASAEVYPADVAALIRPTRERFTRWLAGIPAIIAPALEVESAAILGDAPPPRVHSKIQLMD